MADTLPLRFRILHYLSTVDKACAAEIMQALEPEYGTERQFTKKVVMDHLLNMKANAIVDDNEVALGPQGELIIYYSVNDQGRRLLKKYLPKRWSQK